MLAGFRDESIPVSYKERHTTMVTKKMFKPRKVFKDWHEDNPEVIRRAIEYDSKFIKLDEIVQNDKQDAAALIRQLTMKFPEIKEIYHYLQGKSSQYPNIDTMTIREQFLKAISSYNGTVQTNELDIVMREVSGNLDDKVREVKKPGWTRFMFIELIFRLARLLYSSIARGEKQDKKQNAYNQISVAKSFDLLFQCDLKPYQNRIGVNWQVFRDNKLQDYEVELVFTMNMPSIDRIYSKYSRMNQDTEHKAHN